MVLGSQPGPRLPQRVTVGLAEGDGSLPPAELWETLPGSGRTHPSISPPTPGHRHWHEWLLGTKGGFLRNQMTQILSGEPLRRTQNSSGSEGDLLGGAKPAEPRHRRKQPIALQMEKTARGGGVWSRGWEEGVLGQASWRGNWWEAG